MTIKSRMKAVEITQASETHEPLVVSKPGPLPVPPGGWPPDEFTGQAGRFVRDPFTGQRSRAPDDDEPAPVA